MVAQFGFSNGQLLLLHIQLTLKMPRAYFVSGSQKRIHFLIQLQRLLHDPLTFFLQLAFIFYGFIEPSPQCLRGMTRILLGILGIEPNARQGEAGFRPRISLTCALTNVLILSNRLDILI